ncbi:hypothetical protein BH09SUM1_BH09SUM1_02000 [soil metagenome]
MTELLVALAVAMVLIAAVAAAFVKIIRSSDEARAMTRANTSARLAVDEIARDLRMLQLDADAPYQQMVLTDAPQTYGDRIDFDKDGATDEEQPDGRDDDGDWTVADDRHIMTPAGAERRYYVNIPDLGDAHVDEDVVFSKDEITFIIPAGLYVAGAPRQRVTYRIGSFDGEDNVLLRVHVDNPPVGAGGTEVVEPIVFDVLSLDILAWNSNSDANGPGGVPGRPYWETTWDATTKVLPLAPYHAPSGVPPFKLPTAFSISVTVNAERRPLSVIPDFATSTRPLRTKTINTVVTVESTAQDSRYFLFVRDP